MNDLSPDAAPVLPHNIEAEQALLGALMVNNEVFDRIASVVEAQHFYDPLHARIFEVCTRRIQDNQVASAVTLKSFFDNDPGMEEIGGPAYLVRLAGAAVSVFNVRDYAQTIYDLAIRRNLIGIGEEIIDRAGSVDVDHGLDDQITEAEQSLYGLGEVGKRSGGFQSFLKSATEAVDMANDAYQRDGGLSGLSTGLMDMDAKLGGLKRSDLLILAGRPSMGKTSLATNIAFNIAKAYRKGEDGQPAAGGRVGFFSLEMSAEQLATRILSEQSEIPSDMIQRGQMDENQFRRFVEEACKLEKLPLFIDGTPALPISAIASRARRLKRTHGLDALFVDYLQLVRPASAKDNRVNEVSEITQGLKAIAKELNIPVIALSQLSRNVERRDDKRPQLSDLRESGSIEQDADVVMFVYREQYYHERERPPEDDPAFPEWVEKFERIQNRAEAIIGKQRHGSIGTVEMMFDGRFTRFADLVLQGGYML